MAAADDTSGTRCQPPPGPPPPAPPPGLELGSAVLSSELSAKEQDTVNSICKDMINRTDNLLQDKVDKLLSAAVNKCQASFDDQQEQVNSSLESELNSCREKVKSLEADKEQMQTSVKMLQEQLNMLTAQFQSQCGWGMPPGMGMGGLPMNSGFPGGFPAFPAAVPPFPGLPFDFSSADRCEASTTAASSPIMTPQLSCSEPPTPQRPPPGLSPGPSSAASWMGSPCLPPPGLSEPQPEFTAKASAPISLSAAIDTPTSPKTPQLKPREAPGEDLHSAALDRLKKLEKENADLSDAVNNSRLQSPVPSSPGFMGTPSRIVARELMASPKTTLNLTPKRTPRLTRGSFSAGMKSPAVNASPFVICESGGSVFGFTIRKADDCSLGLETVYTDKSSVLTVTGVKSGGAMQAWNKQCMGGPAAGKAVLPGDQIVKVNNSTTPLEMLEECRDQKLLRFTVQRGEVDDNFDPRSLQPWGIGA